MGGAWERMTRSTCTILKSIANEQLLTDEKLLTLIVRPKGLYMTDLSHPLATIQDPSQN
ncbi:hypothetical protein DPMN_095750 [Dreissena polymorpha]|uniref:Uncharacterized protein n=1 Tax=Dreissena polymorpha TaxID=45954 RepID=A0A9D4L9Z1_DREPO|nr:hypothetical protein DPMN_095750 [Dreissena polymorpha]